MPAVSLVLGAIVLTAMWIGGNLDDGLQAFVLFVAVAALFAFGGRSETVRALGGPGRDERWQMIDLRASAFAGFMVIVVLTGAWLWELAHGNDGDPYGRIMAVGGVSYLLAIAFLRWRG
jgi:hypothetical protein